MGLRQNHKNDEPLRLGWLVVFYPFIKPKTIFFPSMM